MPTPPRRHGLIFFQFLLFFCGFFLIGCDSRQRVRIAVAAPLTGDEGSEGQGLWRAAALAIEDANDSKHFPFRIDVLPMDDRALPSEAVNAANLIVSDPAVIAVIGHYNSGCALKAARIYSKAGLAMISPSASSPQVTLQQRDPAWQPKNVFRLVPTDDVQGAYAGEFLFRKLRARRLALVYDDTPYGRGLAEYVRRRFTKLGGRVVITEGISTSRDFKPLLRRVRDLRPDVLYFGGLYVQAGLMLRQMRDLGIGVDFVSGDGAHTGGLFAVAGDAADGAYVSMLGAPAESLPRAGEFIAKYRARYGAVEIGPFDYFAYEAAQIVLEALARVGPDRRLLIEAIRRTDRMGLLGRVRFNADGDIRDQTVTMRRANWKTRSFNLF